MPERHGRNVERQHILCRIAWIHSCIQCPRRRVGYAHAGTHVPVSFSSILLPVPAHGISRANARSGRVLLHRHTPPPYPTHANSFAGQSMCARRIEKNEFGHKQPAGFQEFHAKQATPLKPLAAPAMALIKQHIQQALQ